MYLLVSNEKSRLTGDQTERNCEGWGWKKGTLSCLWNWKEKMKKRTAVSIISILNQSFCLLFQLTWITDTDNILYQRITFKVRKQHLMMPHDEFSWKSLLPLPLPSTVYPQLTSKPSTELNLHQQHFHKHKTEVKLCIFSWICVKKLNFLNLTWRPCLSFHFLFCLLSCFILREYHPSFSSQSTCLTLTSAPCVVYPVAYGLFSPTLWTNVYDDDSDEPVVKERAKEGVNSHLQTD